MRKTLKVQLAEAHLAHEHYRINAGRELAAHISKIRTLETTVLANATELRELRDQVAMQHSQNAAMSQDAANAIQRYNVSVRCYNTLLGEREATQEALDAAQATIEGLSRNLTNRLWGAGRAIGPTLRRRARSYRERLKNWWVVRRLNRGRVDAMREAGYIPRRLIKVARDYWEADKERLGWEHRAWDGRDFVRQGLWAKLKILVGRR